MQLHRLPALRLLKAKKVVSFQRVKGWITVDLPDPFLASRLSDDKKNPRFACICPGFELRRWRFERLAAHLIDWLPDFAIKHEDLPPKIENITDYRKLIEGAAARIYRTEKSELRGEIGEILLHAFCRQFSGTFPAISKVYYKDSSNHTVKGFDLVHTRYDESNDELQLWLGEAKFYTSGADAVADAIASVRKHLEAGFLTNEKIFLGNKISGDTPGYSKLQWLFERDTPLDHIFQRLVVPILVAYNSPSAARYENDESYAESLIAEIARFQEALAARLSTTNISVYCFYFPMNEKKLLISEFDKKLGAFT